MAVAAEAVQALPGREVLAPSVAAAAGLCQLLRRVTAAYSRVVVEHAWLHLRAMADSGAAAARALEEALVALAAMA